MNIDLEDIAADERFERRRQAREANAPWWARDERREPMTTTEQKLRKALAEMVLLFGNPKRDEWLTKDAFDIAVRVTQNAEAVLSETEDES